MTEKIDHKKVAWSRLAYQYRNAENLKKFIAVFCKQAQEIEDVLFKMLDMLDIEKSEGHQLDVIGKILGQPRNIANADIYSFFAFEGTPRAQGFNVGYLWDGIKPTRGNLLLNDDLYRKFLIAKTIKNYVSCKASDILNVVSIVVGTYNILYFDGRMEIVLSIGKILTDTERAILLARMPSGDYLLPKPEGVRLRFIEFNPDAPFGFHGTPGVKGFNVGHLATMFGETN